jgi:hypothetical protein
VGLLFDTVVYYGVTEQSAPSCVASPSQDQ